MAWTTPKTWGTEVLTSSDMNTYVSDNLTYLEDTIEGLARLTKTTTSTYSTTSTSFVNIDGAETVISITTSGRHVLVSATGRMTNIPESGVVVLQLLIDGTAVFQRAVSGAYVNNEIVYIATGLSAGAHTFRLQYRTTGTSSISYVSGNQLAVREIF